MLEPSTNKCMGFVSDKQVKKELGLSRARFNNFVMYQKLYKGCILIEDESEDVRDGTTETFELIDTSKTGRRWYISNYLNVVSVGEDGKQREIKPVFDKGSYRVSVNGKVYESIADCARATSYTRVAVSMMCFNQIIEIIDGEITKDEEVKFDDYNWDCICPNIGG